jgi:hypothetical protein
MAGKFGFEFGRFGFGVVVQKTHFLATIHQSALFVD